MTFTSPKHIPTIQLFKCWKTFNFYIHFLQLSSDLGQVVQISYTLYHDQNWWMDRTSSASPRVIFGVVEVPWRVSWSFLGPTKAKTSKNHHSWSQHVMIRELNYESGNALLLPCVFIVCFVIFWDVWTTLRLLKWPWPLFETVDWLQTPAEVPWSVIYSMNFETLDFFSRFTRILDKFHPPGTLVPFSVLCVFLWLRYLLLSKKSQVRVQISPSRLQQSLWWFKQQWWWLQNLPESTGWESSQENHPGSQHKFTCGC